jgi:pimeloyl-ACP methyl ester carboxylesterase
VVIGNSFGGSAAVLAAARSPHAVSGLVLLSPFLRSRGSRAGAVAGRLLYRVLFARPWGAAVWSRYYAGPLNRGRHAPWLAEHVAAIRSSFSEPRRLAAFRHLAVALDHSVVEPVLDSVRAPALIVVGALDPDYPDPRAELDWMGERLAARVDLVPDAAHYPHTQRPDLVVPLVVDFARSVRDGSARRSAVA